MEQRLNPNCHHRFPAKLINHAVWLYHVFSLSFRDSELILAKRGWALGLCVWVVGAIEFAGRRQFRQRVFLGPPVVAQPLRTSG